MDILKSIAHPDEVMALFKYKHGSTQVVQSRLDETSLNDSLRTCYKLLTKTSRSFSVVIKALDKQLRDSVCVFYLVLRALDTVEDDMSIPNNLKIQMLKTFHEFLYQPEWNFTESQEKDKIVLEKFPVISREFRALSVTSQQVIADICQQMGQGMVEFLDRPPKSLTDWDQYCHYVAGLVGVGLTRLFVASGLETDSASRQDHLSNCMGLMLQKTNIIRDYLEDVTDKRYFWPEQVWSKYGDSLDCFSDKRNQNKAVCCLNELVTNALCHVPQCIQYLSTIRNQSVFNFCAIPQVMAIATLERCYDNPVVFSGIVKIRRGEAVKLMMSANSLSSVKTIMRDCITRIGTRVKHTDPSASQTILAVQQALHACDLPDKTVSMVTKPLYHPLYLSMTITLVALVWSYWHRMPNVTGHST